MIKRDTSQICLWVGMVLMLAVSAKASTLDPGKWTQTGNLNFAREYHTATLLPNGKVLVAGGNPYSSTSELYDPATGTWTQTGNLNFGRYFHTATLLPNGKVLVAGGAGGDLLSPFLVQSELYDPATGTWSQTGNLNVRRGSQTATLLPNGKVLVAGGSFFIPDLSWDNTRPPTVYYPVQSELYDPATGTWTQAGNLNSGRDNHTATLLSNGKVLVAGGSGISSELYDPATGTWSQTGNLNFAREYHTATLLPNGKVLVAGTGGAGISSELYDPATGTWTQTGNLNFGRRSHTATLLPNGKVLVAGGDHPGGGSYLVQSELYNPATGTWTQTGNLNHPHANHTATLLSNGKVLVAGYRLSELFRSKTNAIPWLQLLLE
jgi:uncharacterized delta-60 repeat protein